jgi:excisionase family DNA binding protein
MSDPQAAPIYMTLDEVAERWKASRDMVAKQIREGRLTKVNIGSLVRVTLADVEAYEAANRTQAACH